MMLKVFVFLSILFSFGNVKATQNFERNFTGDPLSSIHLAKDLCLEFEGSIIHAKWSAECIEKLKPNDRKLFYGFLKHLRDEFEFSGNLLPLTHALTAISPQKWPPLLDYLSKIFENYSEVSTLSVVNFLNYFDQMESLYWHQFSEHTSEVSHLLHRQGIECDFKLSHIMSIYAALEPSQWTSLSLDLAYIFHNLYFTRDIDYIIRPLANLDGDTRRSTIQSLIELFYDQESPCSAMGGEEVIRSLSCLTRETRRKLVSDCRNLFKEIGLKNTLQQAFIVRDLAKMKDSEDRQECLRAMRKAFTTRSFKGNQHDFTSSVNYSTTELMHWHLDNIQGSTTSLLRSTKLILKS